MVWLAGSQGRFLKDGRERTRYWDETVLWECRAKEKTMGAYERDDEGNRGHRLKKTFFFLSIFQVTVYLNIVHPGKRLPLRVTIEIIYPHQNSFLLNSSSGPARNVGKQNQAASPFFVFIIFQG